MGAGGRPCETGIIPPRCVQSEKYTTATVWGNDLRQSMHTIPDLADLELG